MIGQTNDFEVLETIKPKRLNSIANFCTKTEIYPTNFRLVDFMAIYHQSQQYFCYIKVITKLPNSEQSYKGKVKTHNYINRQNQSTTGKL
jgi:hypothetical protein